MAQTIIELNFETGEDSYGIRLFRPGAPMQGTVTIFTDEEVRCEHLYLRLSWHTEGRGTRFHATLQELDLFQGTLKDSIPTTFHFDLRTPDEPWSYEGHYVSVVWNIEVQIDIPWRKDTKYVEPLIIAPDRKGQPDF